MSQTSRKFGLKLIVCLLLTAFIFTGCSFWEEGAEETPEGQESSPDEKVEQTKMPERLTNKRAEIIADYEGKTPQEWGIDVSGVVTSLDTKEQVVALTLDACGGSHGSGYDKELIDFLIEKEISATLFINGRWIDENRETFEELEDNYLFEIANHGSQHLPLSVSGRSAYGIEGTESVAQVVDEVLDNRWKIKQILGEKPDYFRSGTAYYDEVAVEIVNELGEEVIGFDISGDGGAKFTAEEVENTFLKAEPGSIILAHMNQPDSETAEGIMEAVPKLQERGFQFVLLSEYEDKFVEEN